MAENSIGTKDQLLIDKMIIKNCKRRKTGIAMALVNYKKASDMVPQDVRCDPEYDRFSLKQYEQMEDSVSNGWKRCTWRG